MASFSLLFLRLVAEREDSHVDARCHYAHAEGRQFEPRLLEHVCEQVPIFLGEGPGSQTILDASVRCQALIDADNDEAEEVTCPLSLDESIDEKWCEQSQLHVRSDGPSPEEASVVRRLEIRIDVADHEQLCPPVVVALVKHVVGRVPDRTCTQMWEDCPPAEEDKVVHGC